MSPGAVWAAVEWIVSRAVPARDREAVVGDLREQAGRGGGGPGRFLAVGLAIAAHYHLEPWRDDDSRLWIAAVGVAGLALLVAVPAAAGPGYPPENALPDALSRAVAALWSTAPLAAAGAAGLLAGHLPAPDPEVPFARLHAVVLLVAFALLGAGAYASAVLLGAAWVGHSGRAAGSRPGTA